MRRIERFIGFALRLVPRAPDGEELAQGERVVSRRLDVDDVLVGGVHVQPVEARGRRLAALDADAARKSGDIALVDDLKDRVIVSLRVLELITGDPGGG